LQTLLFHSHVILAEKLLSTESCLYRCKVGILSHDLKFSVRFETGRSAFKCTTAILAMFQLHFVIPRSIDKTDDQLMIN